MLVIPWDVIDSTTSDQLEQARNTGQRSREYDRSIGHEVRTGEVTADLIDNVRAAAAATGYMKFVDALDEITAARSGTFRQVKNHWAASEVLLAYLRKDAIDGWVYVSTCFGHDQPVLVTDIINLYGSISIKYAATLDPGFARTGAALEFSVFDSTLLDFEFRPGRPETLLRKIGVQKETEALRSSYLDAANRLNTLLAQGPGVRGTVTGTFVSRPGVTGVSTLAVTDRPVITDTTGQVNLLEIDDPRATAPATVPGDLDLSRVPQRLWIEVFDTVSHQPFSAHINDVHVHTYQDDVRDLLVLPDAHRRLLDIITFDTGFAADLLEDRTAGSTILTSGPPGCGKTLTAQVYAEVLHKPLYSVDAGVLLTGGINGVHTHIATVFERCRRWNAVLLLDEVDVIVGRRGSDIDRNTLTAAFLRVMETFDRLTFMTTNRLDDVDDAIISRCAACLEYTPPAGAQAERVWSILSALHNIDLGGDLTSELVATYSGISPRGIRQLLRLAVQVSAHDGVPLSLAVFDDVAQFRGVSAQSGSGAMPTSGGATR